MPSPIKEERILELFMNEPTKHWHFSDIVATSGVSVNIAAKWLRRFQKARLIRHIKPERKSPYFIGNYEGPEFKVRKRLYAMQKLYETGLIGELQRLPKAKTVIIFGSFMRSDWNTESDIDVFVYGDSEDFRFGRLWKGLGFQGRSREIEVHTFGSKKDLKKSSPGLLRNVVRGYVVKGDICEVIEAGIA